jgi:hypothetical protein
MHKADVSPLSGNVNSEWRIAADCRSGIGMGHDVIDYTRLSIASPDLANRVATPIDHVTPERNFFLVKLEKFVSTQSIASQRDQNVPFERAA